MAEASDHRAGVEKVLAEAVIAAVVGSIPQPGEGRISAFKQRQFQEHRLGLKRNSIPFRRNQLPVEINSLTRLTVPDLIP